MKVFISSVIRSMEEARASAVRAVRVLGHEPRMAGDFGARPETPQQACLAGVRDAELVVLILGSRYGDLQASGLSATHELRPAEISSAYQALLSEGLQSRTVLHHHRVLKQALQQAVRWQLIGVNPAEAVMPPRPQRREMHVLSPADVEVLLEACKDDDFRRLIFVATATGLRLGELLGLKWHDIDAEGRTLSIQRTAQFIDGVSSFSTPKTLRSHRTVAYSTSTAAVLQEQRTDQVARRLRLGESWREHDLIFPHADGSPAKVSNLSHRFANLARLARLPVRFHDLRHTMATLALRAGVHPKVVSERLGHASVQITLDTYSHVMPDIQGDAAQVLERVLPVPRSNKQGRLHMDAAGT